MVSCCYIQVDSGEESSLISTDMLQEESQLSILPSDLESLDVLNQHELSFPRPGSNNNENLALVPVDSESHLVSDEFGYISHLTPLGGILGKNPTTHQPLPVDFANRSVKINDFHFYPIQRHN